MAVLSGSKMTASSRFPGILGHHVGYPTVCIASGDPVRVFHASAAPRTIDLLQRSTMQIRIPVSQSLDLGGEIHRREMRYRTTMGNGRRRALLGEPWRAPATASAAQDRRPRRRP